MPAVSPSKYVVHAGWDDVAHLSEKAKAEMLAATPPFLRKARSKGEPSLGAGAIYPIEEEQIIVPPFALPEHWPRIYGMDVGWNRTAVIWAAWDRDSDIVYLYSEHYVGQERPAIHASAVKARGEWIPGVIDPASKGRSQDDGEQLLVAYRNEGLQLYPALNSVEAGLYLVWERLEQGRLKVFSTLGSWLREYRIYRRDEHGKIVKSDDHLMDAGRYLIVSGLKRAITKPVKQIVSPCAVTADSMAGY